MIRVAENEDDQSDRLIIRSLASFADNINNLYYSLRPHYPEAVCAELADAPVHLAHNFIQIDRFLSFSDVCPEPVSANHITTWID